MRLQFLDSDDCVLQLETNGRWVRITGGDDGACVSIPGIDLPRLVHELQIIANAYPCKRHSLCSSRKVTVSVLQMESNS
jgi:hypothetical protein